MMCRGLCKWGASLIREDCSILTNLAVLGTTEDGCCFVVKAKAKEQGAHFEVDLVSFEGGSGDCLGERVDSQRTWSRDQMAGCLRRNRFFPKVRYLFI